MVDIVKRIAIQLCIKFSLVYVCINKVSGSIMKQRSKVLIHFQQHYLYMLIAHKCTFSDHETWASDTNRHNLSSLEIA